MKNEIPSPPLSFEDFLKVDIRVGTILEVKNFEKAKKPAYQVTIDFGVLGIKKTSAQITQKYTLESLIGKQVMAVVNFPPKQIANFMSECLLLGVVDEETNAVTLLTVDMPTTNGLRML
jgi:tRNA-binding protein